MLKKVHISEPEGKSSAILETARCPICDRVSVNSVHRDCDEEDMVCKIGQQDLPPSQESGDSIAGPELCRDNMKTPSEPRPVRGNTLASGDHHHCSKCFRAMPIMPKSKSLNNIDANDKPIRSRFSLREGVKGERGNTMEATIKYKNVNFRESDSLFSVAGISEEDITKNDTEHPVDIIHRPINCPVMACRKMIARASILQHFIFDHSKTPRVTLNISEVRRVYINISAITKEIRCYSVLLMKIDYSKLLPTYKFIREKEIMDAARSSVTYEQNVTLQAPGLKRGSAKVHIIIGSHNVSAPLVHTDSDTPVNGGYKNASFLLMGVRLQRAETIKKPHGSCVYMRHAQTQTEVRSSKINLNTKCPKEMIIADEAERYLVNHHGTIMLWICNLGNTVNYYNITINRSDKKLGYSFTGEALNIGLLDLPEMYDQLECLRILEKHSIKLLNEQNELEVTVNIFK